MKKQPKGKPVKMPKKPKTKKITRASVEKALST